MERKSRYDIKNEDFSDFDPKRERAGERKPCPHCGKPLETVRHGRFLFCARCHRRLPFVAAGDQDTPIKEMFRLESGKERKKDGDV